MEDDRIQKIMSRGFWRIRFRPREYDQKRIPTLDDCQRIIEGSVVHLRGWDYPHLDHKETKVGHEYVESGCDWNAFIERWRLHLSGQFVHYIAMTEDWGFLDSKAVEWTRQMTGDKADKYMSITNCLYEVTEIYEFAARLAHKGVLSDEFELLIELGNTRERQLLMEPMRVLHDAYICRMPAITITYDYQTARILQAAHEMALGSVIEILKRFNWNDPAEEVLRKDQEKFLAKAR